MKTDQVWTRWIEKHGRSAFVVLLVVIGLGIAIPFSMTPPEIEKCLLLERNFRPASLTRIEIVFAAQGLDDYEIRDSQVWIPRQERHRYLQAISQDPWILPDVQPEPSQDQMGIFMPRRQQDRIAESRKRDKLRAMILQFPFVEDVQIETDRARGQRFMGQDRCTAVVMVTPTGSQPLNMNQVEAIRRVVAGSYANMNNEDIVVADRSLGSAYDQINEQDRLHLLSISWQDEQQSLYQSKIESVLADYDDLEIEVRVEGGLPQLTNGQVTGKPVEDIPVQLPNVDSPSVPPSVREAESTPILGGANGVARIAAVESTADFGQPASFQQRVAMLPNYREVQPPPNSVNSVPSKRQVVHVVVRIPASTVLADPVMLSAPEDGLEVRFQRIEKDISEKVRSVLPKTLAQSNSTIRVLMTPRSVTQTPGQEPWTIALDHLVKHWPIWAVAMLGFVAMVWVRMTNKPAGPTAADAHLETICDDPDRAELKSQLSSLIDRDPETAAKVIKNWIRDGA